MISSFEDPPREPEPDRPVEADSEPPVESDQTEYIEKGLKESEMETLEDTMRKERDE
jgi:hypothetical protein